MSRSLLQLIALLMCLRLHAAGLDKLPSTTGNRSSGVTESEQTNKQVDETATVKVDETEKKPGQIAAKLEEITAKLEGVMAKQDEANQELGQIALRPPPNIGFWIYLGPTALGGLLLFSVVYYFLRFRGGGAVEDVRDSLVKIGASLDGIRQEVSKLHQEVGKIRGSYASLAKAVDDLESRLPLGEEELPVTPQSIPLQLPTEATPVEVREEPGFHGSVPHPPSITRGPISEEPSLSTSESAPATGTSNPPPSDFISPSAFDTPRRNFGRLFLREIQNAGARDITHHWESFVNDLRQSRSYGKIESRTVYWDRSASEMFVEYQSDTFRDTGWCYLLSIEGGNFLFFPKLVEAARKSDLPNCLITSSGEPILRAENLIEFIPPEVQRGGDGWVIIDNGEVKYR
jgi:prefoldin subunit 5